MDGWDRGPGAAGAASWLLHPERGFAVGAFCTVVQRQHFGFVPARYARDLAGIEAAGSAAWQELSDSWNRLEPERRMAGGGHDRLRRFAAFSAGADGGPMRREPLQPWGADRDPLDDGSPRSFAPMEPTVPGNGAFVGIARFCRAVASRLLRFDAWRIEAHQLRIEAAGTAAMAPPPLEDEHRDGVGLTFMIMIRRRNLARGESRIETADGVPLGGFTLDQPGDIAVLDLSRVRHGASPIARLDPKADASRDLLILSFRRALP